MFSLFSLPFAAGDAAEAAAAAVAAEPEVEAVPPVTPDITKVDSIEDGFGFFRLLWDHTTEWFLREQENLLFMAIGVAVTLVAAFLVRWLFLALLPRALRKLPSKLPLNIVEQLGSPLTLLLLLIGLSACNNLVHFPGSIDLWLAKIFYAGFILAFLWGIFRIIAVVDLYFKQRRINEDRKLNQLLADLIRRSIKTAVWAMAVIFIAQNLFNLNVAALITGAGVAGLAIAFAAQNTVANLFGAMSIISDRAFKVGDRVTIGDASGSVEAVGFRSTKLRSLDGTIWNVPNRIVADSTIENITERPFLKHAFTIGLVYSTTPEQMRLALKILGEILDHHPGFDPEKQPPLYFFTDFQACSLDISVIVWFQTLDFVQMQKWKQEINLAILERFNAAGLEFAFPTSTNYLIAQNTTAETNKEQVVK